MKLCAWTVGFDLIHGLMKVLNVMAILLFMNDVFKILYNVQRKTMKLLWIHKLFSLDPIHPLLFLFLTRLLYFLNSTFKNVWIWKNRLNSSPQELKIVPFISSSSFKIFSVFLKKSSVHIFRTKKIFLNQTFFHCA